MACLLVAEEIARSTDVQIASADLEAGTEPVVYLDSLEALLARCCNLVLWIGQEIGDASDTTAANPASELVQLSQAKAVGAPDDNRVGARDIESVLDDVRRQQNVALPIGKAHHGSNPSSSTGRPIRTFLLPFDPLTVREALLREQRRGGQSFRRLFSYRRHRRAYQEAHRARPGSRGADCAWKDRRRTGGVCKRLRSTSPTKALRNVRGIGVAVRLRTWNVSWSSAR